MQGRLLQTRSTLPRYGPWEKCLEVLIARVSADAGVADAGGKDRRQDSSWVEALRIILLL